MGLGLVSSDLWLMIVPFESGLNVFLTLNGMFAL